MDLLTNASVESLITKILSYAALPLSEFNQYEAFEMVENLNNVSREKKHAKHLYNQMVYQTLRGKISVSIDHFHMLVLRLLRDKDHEKVFNIVSKVEKRFQQHGYDVRQLYQQRLPLSL